MEYRNEILRLRYEIPNRYKISTNKIYSWMHWQKRKNIADRFHYLTKEDCNSFVTINKKVNIRMRFYFKSHALDSSNCSFMAKMLEDWLVENWLLKSDTNKDVWEFTIESVELDKKEKKELNWHYVRIYIYEHKGYGK